MSNISGRGKLIAIFEMIAGVSGIYAAVTALFKPVPSDNIMVYSGLLMLASLISLFAGVMLYRGTVLGLRLSYLTQLIQVPVLLLEGFYFQVLLLGGFVIGFDSTRMFIWRLFVSKSRLYLAYGEYTDFMLAGVNVLPLIIIFLLRKEVVEC